MTVFAIHIQLKVHIVLAVTQVQTTLDLSFTYLVIISKYVVMNFPSIKIYEIENELDLSLEID